MKKLLLSLLTLAMILTAAPLDVFAIGPSVIADKPEDGVTFDQPFASWTGESQKFRIPALATLEDGTVLAGIDARWGTYLDGGGLDTIVSSSKDNGETWYYTYANHLGDNGNAWNRNSSCFIDPAFAVDGNKVYMMVDLWPGGYALNGANHAPIAGQNGFDSNGHLRLTDVLNNNNASVQYNYHLVEKENGTLEDYYEIRKNSDNSVVEGYTIDAYFNITSANDKSNLFFWDSPFKVYPTNYLWLNNSEDGGKTWSLPTLVNVKYEHEQTFLVAPGTGLVVDKPDGTKRILFTGYEFTGGDKNSWAIYSDDGGLTWKRGGKCAEWSSESTITQVGEVIYIFTRHGGYYTSTDYGESWSAKKNVGIAYNSNCMIHAITYSKKIEGKDAILLSAPSNTGSRSDGKIFVGLVQEDGSLDWRYSYAIDNSENSNHYAYSCLTELKDGRIAVLYEHIDAGAKYEVHTIEEITNGATIGDYWFRHQNEKVNSIVLYGDSTTVSVIGLTYENDIHVSVENEDIVQAYLDGNQLGIYKRDRLLGETDVYLDINGTRMTLHVTVVPNVTETIKHLEVKKGETIEFIDENGDFTDELFEELNIDVAEIEALYVDGMTYEAKLGDDASFNGNKISLDECLFTFEKEEGNNIYTVKAEVDGQTVYLGVRASGTPGIPVSTNQTTLTIQNQGNDKFSFADNASGDGGYILYFHTNSNLRFDRNGSLSNDNTRFYVLEKAEANDDQIIKGYDIVTKFEDGKQYLIANRAENGRYYVLNPSLSSNKYAYVAEVLDEPESIYGTTFELTGINEGLAEVMIGDTAYFIDVTSDKVELTMGVGDTHEIAGECESVFDDKVLKVDVDEEVSSGPYEKVSGTVVTGKYLIGNDSHLTLHNIIKDSWAQTGIQLKSADFINGSYKSSLWTITAVEGGYTIQAENGKYLNFKDPEGASASISLEDNAQVLQITNKNQNGYDISYVLNGTKYYFNNFGGANVNKLIAGYNQNDVNWRIYKPTQKSTTLTALSAGTSSVVIGDYEYAITVVDTADYSKVDKAFALVEQLGNLNQYTKESVEKLQTALDAVEKDLPYSKQSEVNAMAANIYLAYYQMVKKDVVLEESVTLDKTTAELKVNETLTLNSTILPEEATDKSVTWTSSNPKVATIKDGVVTALKAGTTTITVTTTNGLKATCKVTVLKEFPFTDVSDKQWYYGVINEAYQLGLMTGASDSLFKPNANMNRAMVAIVFHRMEGSKKVEYSSIFPDVANKQYYTTSVLWAKQTGVINGYTNGTFKPLRNVTREEMATMIYNFARYKGLDMSASKDITYFEDYNKITPYAVGPLQWAVEKGLMSGKDNGTRLDPLGTATRAECSKMLVQAYKVIYK